MRSSASRQKGLRSSGGTWLRSSPSWPSHRATLSRPQMPTTTPSSLSCCRCVLSVLPSSISTVISPSSACCCSNDPTSPLPPSAVSSTSPPSQNPPLSSPPLSSLLSFGHESSLNSQLSFQEYCLIQV